MAPAGGGVPMPSMKFDVARTGGGDEKTGSASGNGASARSSCAFALAPERPRPPRRRRRAPPATLGAASFTRPLSRIAIVARIEGAPPDARILAMGPSPDLFDLTGRGAVVLTGKDRASFLHGLVTNDIKKLTPGSGCAAAFLTPKGKLLADCVVLCEEDRLEIDCEPELAEKIEDLLRKYLVFNDVQIENHTSETAVFHLQHPAAGDAVEELLRKVTGLGPAGALPDTPHAHVPGVSVRLVRENRTGVPGYDVRCPSSLSEEIRKAFLSAGVRQASDAEMESRQN